MGSLAPLVLVVDDFADGRELYTETLRLAGYRTSEAAGGLEALASARATPPDLVLLDASMPRLDGWQTMAEMKNDPQLRDIPVVVMSGYIRLGDRERAQGSAGFVEKPLLPDDLLAIVERIVGRVDVDAGARSDGR